MNSVKLVRVLRAEAKAAKGREAKDMLRAAKMVEHQVYAHLICSNASERTTRYILELLDGAPLN